MSRTGPARASCERVHPQKGLDRLGNEPLSDTRHGTCLGGADCFEVVHAPDDPRLVVWRNRVLACIRCIPTSTTPLLGSLHYFPLLEVPLLVLEWLSRGPTVVECEQELGLILPRTCLLVDQQLSGVFCCPTRLLRISRPAIDCRGQSNRGTISSALTTSFTKKLRLPCWSLSSEWA